MTNSTILNKIKAIRADLKQELKPMVKSGINGQDRLALENTILAIKVGVNLACVGVSMKDALREDVYPGLAKDPKED